MPIGDARLAGVLAAAASCLYVVCLPTSCFAGLLGFVAYFSPFFLLVDSIDLGFHHMDPASAFSSINNRCTYEYLRTRNEPTSIVQTSDERNKNKTYELS
jgi:hypothetical protein